MSKKRREDQKSRQPLKPKHYLIGAAVLLASIGVSIGVVTLLGGASLSAGDEDPRSVLPKLGAELEVERSPAADVLGSKTWDEMTPDEHLLVQNEVTRHFENASFRVSNAFVLGLDVFIRNSQTRATRQYYLLTNPTATQRIAEHLSFFCDTGSEPAVRMYRYEKLPDGVVLSNQGQDERTQPWEIIVSGVNWDQGVTDLGFKDIGGRRAHGLRLVYNSNSPEFPTNRKEADYWFDVENARLLERQEIIPDADTSGTRYRIEWRELPPIDMPPGEEQPDCVPDVLALLSSGV